MGAQHNYRKVKGLRWAKALEGRPSFIPIGRPRGAKAQGCRYEARLGQHVIQRYAAAKLGPWFEFEDERGLGVCQPDILLPLQRGLVLVLESKLTWVNKAAGQISELYAPVIEAALGGSVRGCVVCRNLTSETRGTVLCTLAQVIEAASRPVEANLIWHHLDVGLPRRIGRNKERLYG